MSPAKIFVIRYQTRLFFSIPNTKQYLVITPASFSTQANVYWTLTDSLTAPPETKRKAAWQINFANGFIFDSEKSMKHYFRCISDD